METVADLSKMKVADLKKHLKNRGLSVTGNKNELVERLHLCLQDSSNGLDEEEINEDELLGEDISQEEESAARGLKQTPTGPKKKLSLKRSEPTLTETKKQAVETKVLESKKPQEKDETAEPKNKAIKLSDEVKAIKLSDESTTEKSVPAANTEESRKKARADRFNVSSEFSEPSAKNSKLSKETGGIDVGKLKKRAERFGEVIAKTLSKEDELKKKEVRKNRFGTAEEKKTAELTSTDAKTARAQRFAGKSAESSTNGEATAVEKSAPEKPTVTVKGKPAITAPSGGSATDAKSKRAQRFAA